MSLTDSAVKAVSSRYFARALAHLWFDVLEIRTYNARCGFPSVQRLRVLQFPLRSSREVSDLQRNFRCRVKLALASGKRLGVAP
jgi:hypothetical protein